MAENKWVSLGLTLLIRVISPGLVADVEPPKVYLLKFTPEVYDSWKMIRLPFEVIP